MKRASWLVTNGRAVVGPVSSVALLRAMERGLVGPDCLVRQPAWAAWRALGEVREVGAWFRGREALEDDIERWLDAATDRGELAHFALVAALRATGATSGLAHLRRDEGFVTSVVAGSLGEEVLGNSVAPTDCVVRLAASGASFVGDPRQGATESGAIAKRLGWELGLRGVAMVPLLGSRRLLGWVELGRSDHHFRRADKALFDRIAVGVRVRSV